MRRMVIFGISLLGALAAVELISSYILFRYYDSIDKELRPESSAAVMLIRGTVNKMRGVHPVPAITVDHGPLFETNDLLGFSMLPGAYEIKEVLHHQVHYFDLTVNAAGRRVASYRPVNAARRLFMVGDSAMFGWGLNDDETIPWGTQSRLPGVEVVNLSLNSYSTIQGLLQLRQFDRKVGADDIVAVEYHQVSNKFNVEAPDVLSDLAKGYELELGGAGMRDMSLPYGTIGADGSLSVRRVSLTCAAPGSGPSCNQPAFDIGAAMRVTERAFDEILAMHPGHLVVVFLSGRDDDPVVAHLRAKGAIIADLRQHRDIPFDDDAVYTDAHMGPFRAHQIAQHLTDVMLAEGIVAD